MSLLNFNFCTQFLFFLPRFSFFCKLCKKAQYLLHVMQSNAEYCSKVVVLNEQIMQKKSQRTFCPKNCKYFVARNSAKTLLLLKFSKCSIFTFNCTVHQKKCCICTVNITVQEY